MDLSAQKHPVGTPPDFPSFFMGGFECSTHKLACGKRLDMVADTQHDLFALSDYQRLQEVGIRVAREGVRWHLVEGEPGRYDFSSVSSIVQAAQATHTQVIWDLCHFGWPDHIGLFKPEFITGLQDYGVAFAQWLERETGEPGMFVPVNEISFFSWAGGDEATFSPYTKGRGLELKQQLVKAALATMDAIRQVLPGSRFVHTEPLIHVVASPKHPEEQLPAEGWVDGRHCHNALWDYPDAEGKRTIYKPLARELEQAQQLFGEIAEESSAAVDT